MTASKQAEAERPNFLWQEEEPNLISAKRRSLFILSSPPAPFWLQLWGWADQTEAEASCHSAGAPLTLIWIGGKVSATTRRPEHHEAVTIHSRGGKPGPTWDWTAKRRGESEETHSGEQIPSYGSMIHETCFHLSCIIVITFTKPGTFSFTTEQNQREKSNEVIIFEYVYN